MIRISGSRKTYGRTIAVNDVSFEVREGEIFGLIGRMSHNQHRAIGEALIGAVADGECLSDNGSSVNHREGMAPKKKLPLECHTVTYCPAFHDDAVRRRRVAS